LSRHTVLIDANVLHKLHLRNLLLKLAVFGTLKPRWSEQILEEFKRSLVRRGVRDPADLDLLVVRMANVFPESRVSGFEDLVGQFGCADPDDEHVLAAAVTAKADVLLTFNLRDFPRNSLEKFGVEILHPDDYLLGQAAMDRESTLRAIGSLLEDYDKPQLTAEQFALGMSKEECPKFAEFVMDYQREIDDYILQIRSEQ
jgi:predicted nucleic acid-binding protein